MNPTQPPQDDDQSQAAPRIKRGKRLNRHIRKLEKASLKHAHTFIIKRWQNVREVRVHAAVWMGFVLLLIASLVLQAGFSQSQYTVEAAEENGTFAEGTLGKLDTLNPILATSPAERSATKLLFAGLLRHDSAGRLQGDLAESWKVLEGGKSYQITLRSGLRWQDGAPLTTDDVIFTVSSIQNPRVRSPLVASWTGVVVKKIDTKTVQFDLPSIVAPFPQLLTTGILPQHKFSGVAPEDMRSSEFNRSPTTSGPFVFRNLQTVNADTGRYIVHMVRNDRYHLGLAKLERFQLHTYGDREQLRQAFVAAEVNAVADFTAQDVSMLGSSRTYDVKDVPVNNAMTAIMKTSDGLLSDAALRKALVLATNRASIREKLGNSVTALETPLTDTTLSPTAGYAQAAFDKAAAERALDAAGWKLENGKRVKNGQPLELSIVSIKTGDYPSVVENLVAQWKAVGISVVTRLENPDRIQQDVILPRLYDVIVYELSIGADPDVFAYWHSSQAGQGLNLANYRSGAVDDALVSARSRVETDLRAAKYKTFMQKFIEDAPAIMLYQPNLHYVTSRDATTVGQDKPVSSLVDYVDRYRNVRYWSASKSLQNESR